MTEHIALLWLLALPLIASPVIYLVGRVIVRLGITRRPVTAWMALAVLLAEFYPLAILAQPVINNGYSRSFIGGVPILMDGISLLLAGTVLVLAVLVIIFSMRYISGDTGEEKYYALLPVMAGSIIGLGCANDLFNLWVWFETMAVASYLLVAFYTNQRGALEAGVKYLVQSAVGSVLVLIGISMIFAQTHTLRLDAIADWSGSPNLMTLAAGALFLIGFGVKTALVPMHTWLPDAHSQAPSGISALLSGVVIEAGLVAMLRALGSLPGGLPIWGGLLLGAGAINMLFGNMMALRQTQVKRLLAYSSLSHIGYMLLGFGAAALFPLTNAAAGGFFHLFTHALMKGLAFLSAGILLYGMHVATRDHLPLILDDLNGASRRYPLAAFGLSVAVLALGGLPPLAGFMSKWQIFAGAAESRSLPLILLVVFAAFNSVLSLAYYAPMVNRMYRRAPSATVLAGKPATLSMAAPVAALLVVVVVIGVWPGLMEGLTTPAANTFVSMFHNAAAAAGPFTVGQ
jgi:proton-translocating NADH-quinone oxidoreductase chain N